MRTQQIPLIRISDRPDYDDGHPNIHNLELNYEEVEQALRYLKEEWQLVQEFAGYHIAEALAADE